MFNPLISIIVPVYNVEKYLNRCIESVLKQKYSKFEILLIDDGSNDNSGIICDDYAERDSRIRVIHKKNEGQGVARNVALDLAEGDYILFVDSDDYLVDNALETIVSILVPDIDLVLFDIVIDNQIRIRESHLLGLNQRLGKEELLYLYFNNRIFTGPVCKLFRKEILTSIRFPNLRCNEDFFILHEIFDKCEHAVAIPDCLYVWFIRQGSTEHSSYSSEKMNLILCCEKRLDFVEKKYPQFVYPVLVNYLSCIEELLNKIYFSKARSQFVDDFVFLRERFRSVAERIGLDGMNHNQIVFLNNEKKYFRVARRKQLLLGIKGFVKKCLVK